VFATPAGQYIPGSGTAWRHVFREFGAEPTGTHLTTTIMAAAGGGALAAAGADSDELPWQVVAIMSYTKMEELLQQKSDWDAELRASRERGGGHLALGSTAFATPDEKHGNGGGDGGGGGDSGLAAASEDPSCDNSADHAGAGDARGEEETSNEIANQMANEVAEVAYHT
jgi:hypothetical protein